jgi:hypothetical protein
MRIMTRRPTGGEKIPAGPKSSHSREVASMNGGPVPAASALLSL